MGSQRQLRILIAEDEPYFRQRIKNLLLPYGEIIEAETKKQALQYLQDAQTHGQKYDLMIIDMKMSARYDGLEILPIAKAQQIYSLILTDYTDTELIRKCYELGCDDYLTKEQCERVIEFIAQERIEQLSQNDLSSFLKQNFLTEDPLLISEMKSLKNRFIHDRSILLLGETGVGKSKMAELIHKMNGGRPDNFVALNVSAIPENLIESELFGHAKGAFSGALEAQVGKIKMADGGTLFLDEIGTMPLNLQKKLLKVLEEKVFYPVGQNKAVHSQFRLISATCENIYQKMRDDLFRSDLFYRMNGIVLNIPALRERKSDISLILQHYLKEGSRRIYIEEEVYPFLQNYSWPGNIRELKNLAQTFMAQRNGVITVKDLPDYLVKNDNRHFSVPPSQQQNKTCDSVTFLSQEQIAFLKKKGLKSLLEKVEIEALKSISQEVHGNNQEMQEILQLSRSGLYRLLNRSLEEEDIAL